MNTPAHGSHQAAAPSKTSNPFKNINHPHQGAKVREPDLEAHYIQNISRLRKERSSLDTELKDYLLKLSEAKGNEPAYLDVLELAELMVQALQTTKSIKSIFLDHELSNQLPEKWASRVQGRSINKAHVRKALKLIRQAKLLRPVEKYELLDENNICRSSNYGQVCNELRKTFQLAKDMRDQDNKILVLQSLYESQLKKTRFFETSLQNWDTTHWNEKAIELKRQGLPNKDIARIVGKSPSTISKFFKNLDSK